MARRSFAAFVAVVLVFAQVATALAALRPPGEQPGALGAANVEGSLLDDLSAGRVDRFVVEFASKANLGGATKLKAKAQKGKFVVESLDATASADQAQASALARATKGVRFTTYWLTNVAVVEVAPGHGKAAAALATRLARLASVTNVRAQHVYPLVEPVDGARPVLPRFLPGGLAPEWGVDKIGAPVAWAAGVTGSGVVVANIDTGVDYLHEALTRQYRGSLGPGQFDHDFAWFDPTGICGDTPCDNAQHGTHTMGTIVGGDGAGPYAPDTGVAPGATWIAAKGCEDFFCTEEALLASGQWMLAPTPIGGDPAIDGDPSMAPDVINNSWGSGPGDRFYRNTVQAWRAAGIIPVFSSGNPGPACGEGGSPGDFVEVLSVGATDDEDLIAEFSGRGPSRFKEINPDVAAPGVDVTSTIPGGGFASFSGTSMAAPHATGTLALMLQANAAFRGDFAAATAALKATALDVVDTSCGPEGGDGDPNNVYGDGRIDAALAVDTVKAGGILFGSVTEVDSNPVVPIAGARVVATEDGPGGRSFPTTTDADGNYSVFLPVGTYNVSFNAFGYFGTVSSGHVVTLDGSTEASAALERMPRFAISGTISAVENGDPIEDARVGVLATPLPQVFTDAAGHYRIEDVPIGTYDLRVTARGCAESTVIEDVTGTFEGDDQVANAQLVRKLDNVGHGCHPIPFDWVDAQAQTALWGDEIGGRLRLPFPFPFYGEEYDEVWLSENGYLNFLDFDIFNFIPAAIPSGAAPNAAIYPLWQDMWLLEGSIDHQTIEDGSQRAFVIEYGVELFGTEVHVDVEVKLWEDGTIDLLYGPNPASANGSQATVGIENADGTDALQVAFLEGVLEKNSAIRIEDVPVGFVEGTVTDRNDGLPVAGATVSAQPGGRSTRTRADGTYRLVLHPGLYSVTISAAGYEPQTTPGVGISVGESEVIDAALAAPTVAVAPEAISESVDFGETTTVPVTITNDGSALLSWEVREMGLGSEPVPLPEAGIDARRTPTYRKHPLPAGVTRTPIRPAATGSLPIVIDDPDDDSTGTLETTAVRGLSDGTATSIVLEYAPGSPIQQIGGYVYLDTDQDRSTGLAPEEFFGLPSQDIGFDYWAELFGIPGANPEVPIYSVETFELVALVPAEVTDTSIAFAVPLEALGGDDGAIDVAIDNGTIGPEDWAPDEGHGTIEGFSDLPWIAAEPATGTTAAGGGQSGVGVTLGSADLAPGVHRARLGVASNAPRSSVVLVDVTLDVGLPDDFGAITGTVSDAHTGEPIRGASVVLHATWPTPADPRDFSATTGPSGGFRIDGPAGTWDVEVSADGYEAATIQATIAAGVSTPGADAGLHRDVPHAELTGDDVFAVAVTGGAWHDTLVLGNPEGHEPLEFSVNEVNLGGIGVSAAGGAADGRRTLPADADPNARTTRGLFPNSTAVLPPGVRDTSPDGPLASWPTGLQIPWGVGYGGGRVWLSDVVDPFEGCGGSGDCINASFSTEGEPGAVVPADWTDIFNADMAYDPNTNRMWQVNVGGDNGIVGWDLATGEALETITGDPWSDISQRGLAYDASTNTFYVGGWNEGVIYHVAGSGHPDGAGTVLDECSPDDGNISGLAWNGSFQLLWVATNSDTDAIYLLDPVTCETQRVLDHPDGGGFGGAALEIDALGNLWTVGQNSGNAYLIESGLPTFSDAPWLTVVPSDAGPVDPDGSVELDVALDASGLAPGIHRAIVVVQTNDPDNRILTREVTLLVTDYLRAVNAGGGTYTDANGTFWRADQKWQARAADAFGHVGGGGPKATAEPIEGTDEDALYRDLREGVDGYRFSNVPNGLYQVDLRLAELTATQPGRRIFDVVLEGASAYPDLDVFAQAGRFGALDLSFWVEVTDGTLDVSFNPDAGHKAIVNALRVFRMP